MTGEPSAGPPTERRRNPGRRREDGDRVHLGGLTGQVDGLAAQVVALIGGVKDLQHAVEDSRRIAQERTQLAQRQIRQRTAIFLALVVLVSVFFAATLALLRHSAAVQRRQIAATVADNCQRIATHQALLVEILDGFAQQARSQALRDQYAESMHKLHTPPCAGQEGHP